MLKELREHSSSWIIKGLMILIASTFILWGSGRISGCNEDVAATVNGEVLSLATFRILADQQLELYREQMRLYFKRDVTKEDEEQYKKIVFNNLIDEVILKQKAEDLDIPISTIETKESIKELPYFQNQEGAFDYDRYLTVIRSYFRKSPEDFEKEKYNDLRVNRLEWIIKNTLLLNSDEKEFETNFKKDKIKLGFIMFDPKNNLSKEFLTECTTTKGSKKIDKLAKKHKLTIENTDFIGRNPSGYIPKIGTDFDVMKKVFLLTKDDPCLSEIVEISGKSYVIWLIDRKEELPQDDSDTYFGKNYQETRKKDSFFSSYKKSLESQAKIKKYIY